MKTSTVLLECLALATMRRTRGLTGKELEKRTRISVSLLSKYENSLIPPPDRLKQILTALMYEVEDYRELVDFLSRKAARCSARPSVLVPPVEQPKVPPAVTPVDPTLEEWRDIRQTAAQVGQEAELAALDGLAAAVRVRKTAEARAQAAVLCDRLAPEPKPWLAVEIVQELRTWAVAEALAHRSAEAAPENPDRALGARRAELPRGRARSVQPTFPPPSPRLHAHFSRKRPARRSPPA